MKHQMHTWTSKDGQIIIHPERGRVMQAQVGSQDLYWVNAFYRQGWNVGGDRLWVGPETDWFWKVQDEPDFSKYEVQKNLDSDNWKVTQIEEKVCHLQKMVTLKNQHDKSSIKLDFTRSFFLADAQTPHFDKSVSYTTNNTLQIRKGKLGQKVDLWAILQVPAGGIVYIPIRGEGQVRNYFDPITDDLCEKRKRVIAFEVTGKQQYKVGISPASSRGRYAYVREFGDDYLVIYREYFNQPWREYCDAPLDEQDTQGDSIQVYNDNGDFGGYGEIEHHTPGLRVGGYFDHLSNSYLTVAGLVKEKQWSKWYHHWILGEED